MVHLLLALRAMRHAEHGFTLIELLVVVLIVGILAAVAVTAFVSTVQRSRQSRTMADMRTAALAIEAYETDHGAFLEMSGSLADVAPYLEPTYIRRLPVNDGWNRPILFDGAPAVYTLVSHGSNGQPDLPYQEGPTSRFSDDIVLVRGQFYQWPSGLQRGE